MALRARKVSGTSEKRPPGMRDYIPGHPGTTNWDAAIFLVLVLRLMEIVFLGFSQRIKEF